MSEKILNTRIQLKGDSFKNWTAQNPILKLNELAIVKIEESDKHALGTGIYFKVGDGVKSFSELGFSGGIDGRVISEAISKNALVATINKTIAEAGIASDEAVQALAGRVTTAEGKITSLEGLVGTKSVATQIAEEIAKLSDVYAPKSHTHTKSEITDFAHTHAMTEVTGLADAIADAKKAGTDANTALETYKATNNAAVKANADAITAINDASTGILAQAKTYADGKDGAINAAKSAADTAQSTIDSYKTSNDKAVKDIKDSIGTVPSDKTVVQMIADAQTAATYDDTQIKANIKTNADAIDTLETLVGSESVSNQISTAVSAAKTELKGSASDTADSATIAGAKKYADSLDAAMDSRVDVLESAIGEGGSVAAQIKGAIEALDVADEAITGQYVSAVSETDGKITVTRADLPDYTDVYAQLNHIHGIDQVTGLQDALDTKTPEGVTQAIRTDLTEAERKLTTLIASDTDKSVRTIANEELAAQLIPEGAQEAFDTLQEIAAWIQQHPEDASAMNARIDALETLVGKDPVSTQINAAIDALKIGDYAKVADLTAAVDRIATLEGKSHTHANKAELDLIASGDKAKWDVAAEKAHTHANATELAKFKDGDKAKLDTAVQTVTAGEGSGLVATKSGTDVSIAIDDTVTFILNCGNSVI